MGISGHKDGNNRLRTPKGGQWEEGEDWKLPIGYHVQNLGNGYTRSLIPTSMQYHVTNIHMYPLNLKWNKILRM